MMTVVKVMVIEWCIGECRNKNCLKGRGGNDVQHKNLEKKNNKDMDYNNSSRRFRPWGSRVKSYELSHVKNEFSLVGLTACQYEDG